MRSLKFILVVVAVLFATEWHYGQTVSQPDSVGMERPTQGATASQNSLRQVEIYPYQIEEKLFISNPKQTWLSILVYDTKGEAVSELASNYKIISVDTGHLAMGEYTIIIQPVNEVSWLRQTIRIN